MKVYLFLANGFEEVEALTPVDVLRRAGVSVTMVSVSGSYQVTGAHQIVVRADQLFTELDYHDAEMLILPGGMPGSDNLFAHAGLKDLLIKSHKKGTMLAAICAAPYIFGQLGFLQGHKVTCYPGFEDRLTGAEIMPGPVVVSDNIITATGVGVAMDFALVLLEELLDQETAKQLAERMVYDRKLL